MPKPRVEGKDKARCYLLKQAPVTERKKSAVVSQHDVIENSYPKHVGGFFESPGDFDVFLAGCWLSAGMVVNEEHRSRAEVKGRAPYFSWMH